MGNIFWIVIGCIAICSIVTNGVVKIINASKSKKGSKVIVDLEADLAVLEQDVEEQRKRIEVLEKIVTDEKYDLGKKIDGLAS